MDPEFLFQTIIAGQVEIDFSVLGVKWPDCLTVSISTHMMYEFDQTDSFVSSLTPVTNCKKDYPVLTKLSGIIWTYPMVYPPKEQVAKLSIFITDLSFSGSW